MGRSRSSSATCACLCAPSALPPSVPCFTALRRGCQRKTGGCGWRRKSPPVEGCKCRRRSWSRQQGTGCWHGYGRPACGTAAAHHLWRPFFRSCSHVRGLSSRPPALLVRSLAAPRPTPLLSLLGHYLAYAFLRDAMYPLALTSAIRNAPYRNAPYRRSSRCTHPMSSPATAPPPHAWRGPRHSLYMLSRRCVFAAQDRLGGRRRRSHHGTHVPEVFEGSGERSAEETWGTTMR